MYLAVIKNELYILFENGNLGKMTLEIPGTIDSITYLDEYKTDTEYTVPYLSYVHFSNFYLRDANNRGTNRGRFMIRTLKYSIVEPSYYTTWVTNTDYNIPKPDSVFGPTWDDTLYWDDTQIWTDEVELDFREFKNDPQVPVLGQNTKVKVLFKSSDTNKDKGFELSTINVEGFFHQRSLRQ
jgi:hypothetical protein